MFRRVSIFVLIWLAASFSSASEQIIDGVQVEAEVNRLWRDRAFGELHKLEASLRAGNRLSPSGWPLSFLFFQELSTRIDPTTVTVDELDQLDSDLNRWSAKFPTSHFGHFLKVHILEARAWKVRGTGYSNTVSPSQWTAFNAYMDQAREYLSRHKKELDSNPNWYECMLTLAQRQSLPQSTYDALLNEGALKHGVYLPSLVGAINRFTPKWGGSYSKMINFIETWSARVPRSQGDQLYARQYSYAIENALFPDKKTSQVKCDRWMNGYRKIVEEFPSDFNYNHAAFAAALCEDRMAARHFFEKLGQDSPDLSLWGQDANAAQVFSAYRKWALALN